MGTTVPTSPANALELTPARSHGFNGAAIAQSPEEINHKFGLVRKFAIGDKFDGSLTRLV